jgi:hypothetical protein
MKALVPCAVFSLSRNALSESVGLVLRSRDGSSGLAKSPFVMLGEAGDSRFESELASVDDPPQATRKAEAASSVQRDWGLTELSLSKVGANLHIGKIADLRRLYSAATRRPATGR